MLVGSCGDSLAETLCPTELSLGLLGALSDPCTGGDGGQGLGSTKELTQLGCDEEGLEEIDGDVSSAGVEPSFRMWRSPPYRLSLRTLDCCWDRLRP